MARYRPPRKHVSVERIDPFHARGMKCVHGRGDHWGGEGERGHHCYMDIFQTRDGRLLMRFWWGRSRYSKDSFSSSFEIKGMSPAMISKIDPEESSIPEEVLEVYYEWIDDYRCERGF